MSNVWLGKRENKRKKHCYYEFNSWWGDNIKSNPFPMERVDVHRGYKDSSPSEHSLSFSFFNESKLILFLEEMDIAISDQDLEIIYGNHSTRPNESQVVFCIQKHEVSDWVKE